MNQVLAGQKFVANFLDSPVRIGMIYQMDDKQFIPVLHFNDQFPNINLNQWISAGSPAQLKFNNTKDVSINVGISLPTSIGNTGVQITFKKKRSVAGVINDGIEEALTFGNIANELKQIWTTRGFDKFNTKYIFVYGVLTAASGTLIYSEESGNEVVLKHKLNIPIGKIADLGSGEFEYVSNKKATLEIIRNTAHKPLFRAFYFRKNWQAEILG